MEQLDSTTTVSLLAVVMIVNASVHVIQASSDQRHTHAVQGSVYLARV